VNPTNDTDRQIQWHLQSARRSVRAALEILRSSEEKGFRARRAARDLVGLEAQLSRVSSTANPYNYDPDLMSEEQIAELSRQRREERRAAREARKAKRQAAAGVTND